MLKWTAIFFLIAIVAGAFGFGCIAAGAADVARVLVVILLIVSLATLIMGIRRK